ncbi:adenine phosphoribosyltransferase [Endozoicomonas elysicola]|uniref:Adenine phosphoribosyltransferase n=1 Tax=Endozoicomonas elysicola TaxID=305900 RepID=A0A081KBW7_9GAMM|nr:adenine phosphoribosyltransferase [Endozoicomonas elysicola]KEI71643.1 hypothetical protein GV64_13650 [Endozoicomonas elysicola]
MLTKKQLAGFIRDVQGYPTKDILFKDITPLLGNGEAYSSVIWHLVDRYRHYDIDCIISMEARGFFFGAPLAVQLKKSFIPARKKGKLPREVISQDYKLDCFNKCLEIHKTDLLKGSRVLIVDDILATGATAEALIKLVEKQGAEVVELAFLIDRPDFKGHEKLKHFPIYSILQY